MNKCDDKKQQDDEPPPPAAETKEATAEAPKAEGTAEVAPRQAEENARDISPPDPAPIEPIRGETREGAEIDGAPIVTLQNPIRANWLPVDVKRARLCGGCGGGGVHGVHMLMMPPGDGSMPMGLCSGSSGGHVTLVALCCVSCAGG